MDVSSKLRSFLTSTLKSSGYIWLVGAIGLTASVALWALASSHHQQLVAREFSDEANRFVTGIHEAMGDLEDILLSGAALLKAHPDVTPEGWGKFVSATGLVERSPGFQGLGFLRRIGPDRWAQARQALLIGGDSSLVGPDSSGDLGGSLKVALLEPGGWQNHRYLIATDPMSPRRVAMERARDSGNLSKTAMLRFESEKDHGNLPGFIVYVPVYNADLFPETLDLRRSSLQGFVAMPFRMTDFVTGVMRRSYDLVQKDMRVEIFDGNRTLPTKLMFDSASTDAGDSSVPPPHSVTVAASEFGQDWTVRMAATPNFGYARRSLLPSIVLASGTALTFVLCSLLWSLQQQRDDMTVARQQSILMTDELAHRVKNTLAVVQSIANRTLSDERSIGEGRELLSDRLGALARTHTLIMENAWLGAGVGEVIRAELAPLGARATAHGPHLTLSPQIAQSLALSFHDLAVDAVRRGLELLTVKWRLEPDNETVVVDWIEASTAASGPSEALLSQIAQQGLASRATGDASAGRHHLSFLIPLDEVGRKNKAGPTKGRTG